jgi:hypothetical protein
VVTGDRDEAVLGAREGDIRSFETPSGTAIDVRVIAIRLP